MEDCINWQGKATGKYGVDNGFTAHKRAWERKYGPVPPFYVVHHVCENRSCVNVDHLVAVTYHEHKVIHYRTGKPGVGKGKPQAYRLSETQIRDSITRNENNLSAVARELKLSRQGLYKYLTRYTIETVRHIKK